MNLGKDFVDACGQGNVESVNNFINNGIYLNVHDSTKLMANTGLMAASRNGHLEIVTLLLQKGADVNVTDDYQLTAIFHAIGKIDIMSVLIAHGANLNVKDEQGYTPFLWAYDHFPSAKLLVENGADPDVIIPEKCKSALIQAAASRNLNLVKNLIEIRCNPNLESTDGVMSALVNASRVERNLEVVEHLASVSDDNEKGIALTFAASYGVLENVKFLLEKIYDIHEKTRSVNNAFRDAAESDQFDVITFLWQNGADVNNKDDEGNTALILASKNGNLRIVNYLLEKNANVNVNNNEGLTPLFFAVSELFPQVSKILLDHGAETNVIDDDHWNPLMYAAFDGDLPIIKKLIEHGAILNMQNEEEKTAFMIASEKEHFDVKLFLIEMGAETEESVDDRMLDLLQNRIFEIVQIRNTITNCLFPEDDTVLAKIVCEFLNGLENLNWYQNRTE